MSSAARPKRPAETFTRTHNQAHKKPRFDIRNPSALAPDELSDDAVLDADVIGTRGQHVKRSAVNVDGYDSDSDDGGKYFDTRAADKAKAEKRNKRKSRDEEEDDMFADLEEDLRDGDESEDGVGGGKKRKAVRFLDEDEIEGQVKSSRSGGHVSADFSLGADGDRGRGKGKGKAMAETEDVESSSESEVDDAVRASISNEVDEELGAGSKKTHAPKLDAFNMRDEQEEGRFDDQGNFVRKVVDPDAIHDLWMEGISKKEMKAAREAEEKREEDRRKRNLEDDGKSEAEVLGSLIRLMEVGETVLEALGRLGKGKEKKKKKWQTKQKNRKAAHVSGDGEMGEEDAAEVKRRDAVDTITAAADLLLTRGHTDIYDAERELLIRQYNREADMPWHDAEKKEEADSMWEYKWTDDRDGGTVNGPYDSNTMRRWNDAGYFGEGVVFRQMGETGHNAWSRLLPV